MKVMLINSCPERLYGFGHDDYFPIGLLSIGTYLRKNGVDVVLRDINKEFIDKDVNAKILVAYYNTTMRQDIAKERPDIIGISCSFSANYWSVKILAECIKKDYNIKIVVGGIHPTLFPIRILEDCKHIDVAIIGEGEETFLDIVQGKTVLDGIAFRGLSNIIKFKKTKFIKDLDKLYPLDMSLLEYNDYGTHGIGWFTPQRYAGKVTYDLITSRSCPKQCNFCCMRFIHGPKIRYRSVGSVLEEVKTMYDKGVRQFHFMDDNFTYDKKRMLTICKGLKKIGNDIKFDIPNGISINRTDGEMVDALVDTGLEQISLAIESGSDYIRNDVIHKNLNREKIYQLVAECKRHKHLKIQGFFVLGMPQETQKTLGETAEMICDLELNKTAIFFAAPYPGTELYADCLKMGLINDADSLTCGTLEHIGFHPNFVPPGVTKNELEAFRKRFGN